MNLRIKAMALGALLGLTAMAAAQETSRLEWKPTAGKTGKYKLDMTANIDTGGTMADMKFGMIETQKIIKVADGKVTIETTVSDFTLMVGGQDMTQMMGEQKTTATSVLNMNGEILETRTDAPGDMGQQRIENALSLYYPNKDVKAGDTWIRPVKGDSKKGTVDGEATYKFEGVEMVGEKKALKVSFSYKEKSGAAPTSASGTYWLAPDNGELLKGEFKLKNVEFQPGMPPADASAKITKIE